MPSPAVQSILDELERLDPQLDLPTPRQVELILLVQAQRRARVPDDEGVATGEVYLMWEPKDGAEVASFARRNVGAIDQFCLHFPVWERMGKPINLSVSVLALDGLDVSGSEARTEGAETGSEAVQSG